MLNISFRRIMLGGENQNIFEKACMRILMTVNEGRGSGSSDPCRQNGFIPHSLKDAALGMLLFNGKGIPERSIFCTRIAYRSGVGVYVNNVPVCLAPCVMMRVIEKMKGCKYRI